jgi:thiol:disulfide interchange protein DsbD
MRWILATAASGLTDALNHRPLTALALLFGAGVATSLSPCIYPMIPITAGIIGGTARAGAARLRTIGLTITYVFGLALFYGLLGLVAGVTGSLFGTVASNPWVRVTVGVLLLLFGLAMLDVIPVALPRRLATWAGGLAGGSYPAVFLLGATSGIVAAPCGAPAFAAVLTWVATTGSAGLGFLYLFVFSLGMTALLVAVGLSSGLLVALPKPGPWLAWVRRAGGVLLLAMAGFYLLQAWSMR